MGGGGGGAWECVTMDLHNNNREFIERFRRLKALYNLKKNMQRAFLSCCFTSTEAMWPIRDGRHRANTHNIYILAGSWC